MGRILIVVLGVVLTVYAFFDVVSAPKTTIRFLPKPAWIAVVVLLPFLGPLLWLFFHQGIPPFLSGNQSRPSRPRGPDDDPDYLRGL